MIVYTATGETDRQTYFHDVSCRLPVLLEIGTHTN